MDEQYVYFVSYSYPDGFGMADIYIDRPIIDFWQVRKIAGWLEEREGWPDGSVVVLSFQLLRPVRQELAR